MTGRAWRGSTRAKRLPPDWQQRRTRVLKRDHGVCRIRGGSCTVRATEVDHVVPDWQGGTDDDDNLQAACTTCHRAKTIIERPRPPSAKRAPERHPGLL